MVTLGADLKSAKSSFLKPNDGEQESPEYNEEMDKVKDNAITH